MAIIYSLVAAGLEVLAEFDALTETNARDIARHILDKIPRSEDTASYSHDNYVFHVKRIDDITVLCMADNGIARRISFAYLDDIHQRFTMKYRNLCDTTLAFPNKDEFSRILSQQMHYFSNHPQAKRLNSIRGQINQVQKMIMENIEHVLEKGEQLELLVDNSAEVETNPIRVKKQSRQYKNSQCWKHYVLAEQPFRLL